MSNQTSRSSDPWSAVVIAATLVLFSLALFLKGLTHDLLLEAAVFLVSLKLILMANKHRAAVEQTTAHLHRIEDQLRALNLRLDSRHPR